MKQIIQRLKERACRDALRRWQLSTMNSRIWEREQLAIRADEDRQKLNEELNQMRADQVEYMKQRQANEKTVQSLENQAAVLALRLRRSEEDAGMTMPSRSDQVEEGTEFKTILDAYMKEYAAENQQPRGTISNAIDGALDYWPSLEDVLRGRRGGAN